MKKNTHSVRLSSTIVPIQYRVFLHPDLEAHVFSGEETITLSVQKPTKEITLHSLELSITSAAVVIGKKTLSVQKISYDEKNETATFHFDKIIPKGKAKLVLSFSGILKDNMRGFYTSRYVVDGKERCMATTQFQATDARRCIPCFDEPAHKAIFEVSLAVAPDKTAISNTLPVSIQEHEAGYKIVSFAPTPKMSTYLLAFLVGDFEWVEKKTKKGVLVRVMTIPGKSHQATFALDVAVRCLEFYEQYFAIPYPLHSLDLIAVPDFSALGMENWGAITFREIGLLLDEKHTSTTAKELIVEVIAHELAHQWFGNLVTMEWWTHLWLNEGFATYISFVAIESIFPEFDVWSQFVGNPVRYGLLRALQLDGLVNTHPVEVEVHHPNEIGEAFDAVSYGKGASVIRMLNTYIGDIDFRDGLRYYLKKHSYKNTSTVHLWEAFEKISGKPVKKMMAVWTGKSGYPCVTAKNSGNKIVLSQKRFYSNSQSAKKSTDTTIWPVPLSILSSLGEQQFGLMSKKSISIPNKAKSWIKLNAHEGSLYRTKYEGELLGALIEPITTMKISSVDRLGIMRDLFAFAESGNGDTVTALEMARIYVSEVDYIVWVEIIAGLHYIANLLADSKSTIVFRTYAQGILEKVTAYVGWEEKEDESHNDTLLRPLILGTAAVYGNKQVIAEALHRFTNRSENPIHADLRGIIYNTVAREGGEKEYEQFLRMYRVETLHEEKERLLAALGAFRNKKLLTRTLEFIMSDEVRMQDRNGGFASVLINPVGRDLGWNFLKKNWNKIGDAYGDGNHLLSRLIGVLNHNTTREAYDDIKTFFKTHSAPAAERTIQQTLEHIDSNVRWLARDGKKIEAWLKIIISGTLDVL